MACESLRIRWDAVGNNSPPQTKGAIKLVPTKYAADFKHNMKIVFDDHLPKWNYRAVPECT
jgi:hypothetical protein